MTSSRVDAVPERHPIGRRRSETRRRTLKAQVVARGPPDWFEAAGYRLRGAPGATEKLG